MQRFKYANTVLIVPCMSNDKSVAISLVFTSACRQKKRYVKFHVKFAEIHQKFTNIIRLPHNNNLTIIYAADNSQLKLAI